MEITRIKQYFDTIADNSSRNKKEELLNEYSHDSVFMKTLEFLYNPLITTGISEKKLAKIIESPDSSESSVNTFTELLDYLTHHNTGRDKDLLVISDFIENHELHDVKDFINKVVSKNLKVGITAKTLNKIFSSDDGAPFVYEFSPMLAADFHKRSHKLSEEFYITQKLDGIRCIAIKNENNVDMFARSGKELLGLVEIEKEILNNNNIPVNTVIDGELLLQDSSDLTIGETFRQTQKVVRKDGDKTGVNFWAFDVLDFSEFTAGESHAEYSTRRNTLNSMLSNGETVHTLPVLYSGKDVGMITLESQKADDAGFEGVMVNNADGLYKNKRTDDLMKVKSFKSADLLCTGVIEGFGKHVGKLGAIEVEYKNGITKVGSGFDDSERESLWNNPDDIVGKIIEVKYFEETIDSITGQPSLRFPVFVGIRDDKTVDDINIE